MTIASFRKGGVMPHAVKLRKVGGSVMLAIPKAMLDALDLSPDASVGLSIKAGRLVVDPKKRGRYSLDELLAQCNRSARRSREDRDWQTSRSVGRELI
jgi:antitoxin ChpS